ncbi:divalent metal cation transporter, partial [Corynebacterium sanguinis]
MSTVEITPAPKRKSGLFGPGLLIAASFIGPGTVTTATVTGANFGYALVWAIVFSIVATIILQEMSVRLGLAARLSTGEALRQTFNSQIIKSLMIILVVSAIGIGGAAYAGGDTTGTALALASVTSLPHVA